MIKYALRDLIPVGQIFRSTGIKGELLGDLDDGLLDYLKEIPYIFIAQNGQSIPYFVEYIREKNSLLFKIKGVDGPEHTAPLVNQSIYLDKEKIQELGVDLSKSKEGIVGFKIYNRDNYIGKVASIQELPGQNIIEVEDQPGVLIPMVEDWILEIEVDNETIKMDFDDEILMIND